MIKVRCDDFDPRIKLETVKSLHELHMSKNIPFTIGVNSCMSSRIGFDKDVVDYVNNTDPATWDIQLHNWSHDRYWAMTRVDLYAYIYANLMMTKQTFIHSNPTILYPPWNEQGDIMTEVCKDLGLTIKVSQKTIRELLKDWNLGNETLFYWHWWTKDDVDIMPVILDKVNKINSSLT